MNTLGGLKIIWSVNALQDTEERTFPVSRHRSKRIHKKLVKRFGGEFVKVPAMWQTPQGIIAHPAYKAELERTVQQMSQKLSNNMSARMDHAFMYGR